MLDCPFYRTLICILFSYQRPFLREKKNHPSLHLAFQQRIFSILYISWVLHFSRRLNDPYYLITTKKVNYSKLLKDQCAFTYTTNYFFCQVFFSKLKNYTTLFKICQVLFFLYVLCYLNFLKELFAIPICNGHTYTTLSKICQVENLPRKFSLKS